MQSSNNIKNIQQQNINHKSKEQKKRRKKNSYTVNFIDKKKLSLESTKENMKISNKKSPPSKVENLSKNKKNINYHIKHQNKPKYQKKTENSKISENQIIKSRKNTNNNSHNLNSNIIVKGKKENKL
jgi:hypothetical protein